MDEPSVNYPLLEQHQEASRGHRREDLVTSTGWTTGGGGAWTRVQASCPIRDYMETRWQATRRWDVGENPEGHDPL